jgi:uncharacterized protein YkwD
MRNAVTRRSRSFGVLAVIIAAGALLTACNPQLENQNFAAINALRSRVGVRQLARSGELNTKAQIQADRMANAGRIFHSSNLAAGVSPGWRLIGENVAVAGSVQAAEAALEKSSPHYANLTNRSFTQGGVGVTVKSGRVYLVQVFVAR